jgi:hypothetical protein
MVTLRLIEQHGRLDPIFWWAAAWSHDRSGLLPDAQCGTFRPWRGLVGCVSRPVIPSRLARAEEAPGRCRRASARRALSLDRQAVDNRSKPLGRSTVIDLSC